MDEHSSDHKASSRLLRLLLKTALISSLLIIIVVGYAVSLLYSQHIIEDAEHDAISVGQAILSLERHQLLSLDEQGAERLSVLKDGFETLDETMKQALSPFNILKIKVFSTDGTIIYSTDHSIIGKNNAGNSRLQIALSGGISSSRQTKEEFTDLLGETKFDVDVVETYIPIFNSENDVVGSFEVYQDVSLSNIKSQEAITKSLATMAIVLTIAFSLSLIIVRVAARELNSVHLKLHKMATVDNLTGIKNRKSIISSIKEEISRLHRHNNEMVTAPLSVIMIDVDDFKSINDNYGHLVGDHVLRDIAQLIDETLREHDLIGRYGGEEFLVLLPDTEQKGAELLAERVRHEVEVFNFTHEGEKIPLTVSLGVHTMSKEKTDYEEVIKQADNALYQAKRAGRNRVSSSVLE
jgi:diguanylate cyclase (GGDEF)-like protein